MFRATRLGLNRVRTTPARTYGGGTADALPARDVRLGRPETGVCSSSVPVGSDRIDSKDGGCCG